MSFVSSLVQMLEPFKKINTTTYTSGCYCCSVSLFLPSHVNMNGVGEGGQQNPASRMSSRHQVIVGIKTNKQLII